MDLELTGLDTPHVAISAHGGVSEATMSSSILSLSDLALHCQDDTGIINTNIFDLTNVSQNNNLTCNNSKIEIIIGNRRKPKISVRGPPNNLIRIPCTKTDDFSKMPRYAVVNARSFFPKVKQCVELISTLEIDFFCVTESWEKLQACPEQRKVIDELSGAHRLAYLGQPRTNTRKARGGGCALLYDMEKFSAEKITINLPRNLELLCVLVTPFKPSVLVRRHLIYVYYNPPNTSKGDIRMHLNFMCDLFKGMTRRFPVQQIEHVLCGDFNSLDCHEVIDIFPALSSLNALPTRKRRVLDYFLTTHGSLYNKPSIVAPLCHGLVNASDHSIILVGPRPAKQVKNNKKIVFSRPMKDSAKTGFAEFLSETDWSILNNFSPDETAMHLNNILLLAVEDFFPRKKSIINIDRNKPWFTFKLKLLQDRRCIEYTNFGNSEKYKQLNREFKKEISNAKKEFKDKKIKSAMENKDFKQVFKNIRILAGLPGKKDEFILPGDEFKSPEQIAEKLSIYFCKISQEYEPINRNNLPERVQLRLSEECVIPQISQDELLPILTRMRKTSSTVEGDIPANIKNEFLDLLCPAFTHLVNNCLKNTVFPECFKLETCIVIPKISPPQGLDELRNLGLTQFSSKVLEAVIIHYLMPFIEDKDDTAQFGGKKNLSCTHYLLELIEFVIESFDKPDCAAIIALMDFSKGFNRLNHSRLLCILSDIGVPGWLLLLILSYLTNRRMRVRYGGVLSKEQNLPGGSPQGGLLSVILFCLYTLGSGMSLSEELRSSSAEDLPALPQGQAMRETNKIRLKYIDDTTLGVKVALSRLLQLKEQPIIPEWMFEDKNPRQLTNYEMTTDRNDLHLMLDDMEKFVELNSMKINEQKTKIVFFNNKQVDGEAKYQCKGKQLEQVESYKVLGYHLQSNLRANEHVDKMISKVNHKLWSLKILMNNCNDTQIGKQFHVTWIVSVLEYCAPIWHGILTQRQSDRIEAVQKRALRLILRKQYFNYQQALDVIGLKSLHVRRQNLCLKFVSKARSKTNLFPSKTQKEGTRQSLLPLLEVPRSRYDYTGRLGKRFLADMYNDYINSEQYPRSDWN